MTDGPFQRRDQILQLLEERSQLTIEELASRLSVSPMTIHRDLDTLVQKGLVRKVHGGVVRIENEMSHPAHCYLCRMHLSSRTQFVIRLSNGTESSACCPHCAFLMLAKGESVLSILTKDFLYERTINAVQAVYLMESEVNLCCMPNILCFATNDDAMRFQQGFGGWIADFEQAREFIFERHSKHI
jgi:DeoR family transcriptional regulator, copper-sensing transcriptional repressor